MHLSLTEDGDRWATYDPKRTCSDQTSVKSVHLVLGINVNMMIFSI